MHCTVQQRYTACTVLYCSRQVNSHVTTEGAVHGPQGHHHTTVQQGPGVQEARKIVQYSSLHNTGGCHTVEGHGTNMNMPRTGRPRKLSPRTERKVACMAKVNPAVTREAIQDNLAVVGVNVCQRTITNVLKRQGLASCCPRKVPLKTKRHLRMRLKFAMTHLEDS